MKFSWLLIAPSVLLTSLSSFATVPQEEIVDKDAAEIEKAVTQKESTALLQKAQSVELWSLKDPPPEQEEKTAPVAAKKVASTTQPKKSTKVIARPPPLVQGRLTKRMMGTSVNSHISVQILKAPPTPEEIRLARAQATAPSSRPSSRVVPPKVVAPKARSPKEYKIVLKPARRSTLVASRAKTTQPQASPAQRRPASYTRK